MGKAVTSQVLFVGGAIHGWLHFLPIAQMAYPYPAHTRPRAEWHTLTARAGRPVLQQYRRHVFGIEDRRYYLFILGEQPPAYQLVALIEDKRLQPFQQGANYDASRVHRAIRQLPSRCG